MKKCNICSSVNRVYLNSRYRKLLCATHRDHIRRYGELKLHTRRSPNQIKIYKNYAIIDLYNKSNVKINEAKISLDKVNLVKKYRWNLKTSGHGGLDYIQNKTHNILLHRLILNAPKKYLVDHINGDSLDNRNNNLRLATIAQNGQNRRKLSKGVSFDKRDSRWDAYIIANNKRFYLGRFKTKGEATKARRNAEIMHFKEFAPKKTVHS